MQQIILGSSSPFRAELLNKLGLNFIQVSPEIDESAKDYETPETLVERLAQEKALAIAETHPESIIIGSDQVAIIEDEILGKPGSHDKAMSQLKKASGKEVKFLTGLALYNAKTKHMQSLVEPFSVHFRELSENQIDFYLKKEQPYQCAGSFKSEGFGISLFAKLNGDDPNTLIGLPLIKLIQLLGHEHIDVLRLNQ